MIKLAFGILIVSAVATLGDYIWYEAGVRHRMVAGIIHGALQLMAVGGVLGWAAGRMAPGLAVGIGAGVLGALSYYAMAPAMGYPAMFISWMIVWLLLAVGEGRLLQSARRPWLNVLARRRRSRPSSAALRSTPSQEPCGGRRRRAGATTSSISPPGWWRGRRAFSRSAGRSASDGAF